MISGRRKRANTGAHSGISGLGDDRQFEKWRFAVECSHHYQADCDQENRMVALNEQFHHNGTEPRLQVTGYRGQPRMNNE